MIKLLRSSKFLAFAPILLAALFLYGCSNDTVTSPADNLDVSYMSTADTMDYSAINTITLDTVKILIRNIKLNVAGSNDSSNFKTGPFVLYLNLNSSVNFITTGMIPEGTYDKIKFEIHKLEASETPPDPEFADSNGRYSAVVKGSFNGTPFVYKSGKSAHQILSFPNQVVVSTTLKSNVTLSVKPYRWFLKNGDYMNPMDSANINDIDNNIKDSFKGFRDNDKNGIPD
jgi:hypothetical protein